MDASESQGKNSYFAKTELQTFTECLETGACSKFLVGSAETAIVSKSSELFEKECAKSRKKRGVNVALLNPEPGYVIKTSINDDKKCFLNICKSDSVAKPTSQPIYDRGNRSLQWSIPCAFSRDNDEKHGRRLIFRVIFHSDTLYLASKSEHFRDLVNNTAMDAVDEHFKVKLNRQNCKLCSTNDKGVEESSEVKKPNAEAKYTCPKFVVKHQVDMELEEFRYMKNSKIYATIPNRLVVVVDLPELESANDAVLDVQEKFLSVKSEAPAKYYLKLPLPYSVDADNGNAKFDATYKKLTVTLPVIRNVVSPGDAIEDSGVDSDNSNSLQEVIDEIKPADSHSSNAKHLSVKEHAKNGSFMEPAVKYTLPTFFCNVFENFLAVTINVKNVQLDSIKHRILDDDSGVHVIFKSPSSGLFHVSYSLCLKIRENIVNPSSIGIEPWDNNIVLTIALKDMDNLFQYSFGLDESSMTNKYFSCIDSMKNKLKNLTETAGNTKENVEVYKEENSMIININSQHFDTDDEERAKSFSRQQEMKRASMKSRSFSESSGDELQSNSGRHKGILKSRSVSESSIDDGVTILSSANLSYDSGHEINSESEYGSLKKTVRFNDVVSRQLYRSNSSILGQRKKNQRKLRNKKRSNERRMSESENSETEERERYKIDLEENEM